MALPNRMAEREPTGLGWAGEGCRGANEDTMRTRFEVWEENFAEHSRGQCTLRTSAHGPARWWPSRYD